MKILCLTARLPYPPDRGDRLRAFNFIRQLSREHELSLISFIASEVEREHAAVLRPYCQEVRVVPLSPRRSAVNVALNLWRPQPLQVLYYRSAAMQRLVNEVLASGPFDVAYVHLFRMAPYLSKQWTVNGKRWVVSSQRSAVSDPPSSVLRPPSAPYRIVDLTDVISREVAISMPYRGLASRLLYAVERPRIERYERLVAHTFEEAWLVTESDRQALAAVCPQANLQVVSNGVDSQRFYPTGRPYQPNSLIFVGHLRVLHNVDAATYLARDILPLVRQQIPDCTLHIVGADPAPEVLRLANSTPQPSSLSLHPSPITITGFVPDLNEYLNRAAVFVAPLRFAAGIQNKVLEAMAAGTPVVTTSLVNEGLQARPGVEVLVGDDPPSLAGHVIALLRDPELRQRIGAAGRHFVRQKYNWENVLTRMKAIETQRQTRSSNYPEVA